MAVHELTPPAAETAGDALLEIRGLEVAYGASAPALRGISLSLAAGKAVALLGANGSGKTTTIRAASGLLPLHQGRITAGEVRLDGQSVNGERAHKIVARGVAQVPEGRMIFGQLTVDENLRIGATGRRGGGEEETLEQIVELFPVLRERFKDRAGYLSGGEQQMLAIGRALMASPRLMLIDEVSLGLAPLITQSIFERLGSIRQDFGTAMLVVEQNARLALEFCDHAYVLENGRVVLEGPAAQLRADPQVQELYLGGAPGESERSFSKAKRYGRRARWLT
jgi:branched-chain amino acid transport system ATP-binding protein